MIDKINISDFSDLKKDKFMFSVNLILKIKLNYYYNKWARWGSGTQLNNSK